MSELLHHGAYSWSFQVSDTVSNETSTDKVHSCLSDPQTLWNPLVVRIYYPACLKNQALHLVAVFKDVVSVM